jgi:hypothetical protein
VSAIEASVASLTRQGVDSRTILLVAPEPGYRATTMDIRAVTVDSWVSAVRQLAETEDFDWLHCIDAGVEYTAASIGLMRNMLTKAGECQAIYTDEAVRADDGEITPIRKPDFNLDLFLAAPHRYLRRVWFRRESWLSAGQFNPEFSQSFEFDALIDYCCNGERAVLGILRILLPWCLPQYLTSQLRSKKHRFSSVICSIVDSLRPAPYSKKSDMAY